jgi:lipopolysaccharide export system protein LptA
MGEVNSDFFSRSLKARLCVCYHARMMGMMALKQTILFIGFLIFSCALVLFSFTRQWDGGVYKNVDPDKSPREANQESYFTTVDYYVLDEAKPLFNLKADELTLNSTIGKTFFFKPKGHVFTAKGDKIDYKGERGVYNQNAEILVLEQDTLVTMPDTEGKSDKMTYEVAKDRVHMEGNVRTKTYYAQEGDWIYLNANEAYFWTEARRSSYLGDVDGLIKRKRVYEDSLYFESNELYLNMNTLKADLEHDVLMKKQNLRATSRRGEIYIENYNKKLKYFVLYDDVKVVEKVMLDGTLIDRKAFSEKLEGLPSESKIILTGYPKVYQLNDVIKGNQIVLRENTEVVEVDDANTKFKVE